MTSPRTALSCAVLLALAPAASADPTTAAQAYRQADELVKQGKLAEACPLYAASFKEDPQLGALLHLADCNEKIGKTASAWAEWNDAAELARSRNDKRETTARARADALAPKLARLHVNAPKTPAPGLVVRRDGDDITVLVGTDMPMDPGEHEIAASAPGYKDWSTKVKVEPSARSSLDVPDLEKLETPVVVPDKPVVHEGHLKITTDPKGDIYLDAEKVATGSYEHDVRAGGHTLRVSAPGMKAYQTEILVGDGDSRTIDVPLEKDVPAVVVAPVASQEDLPSVELALGTAGGFKLRRDNPAVTNIRLEIGLRFGRRVNFGVYAEYGTISTSNACGFDMPGALPTTPYDFGQRVQFNSCKYFLPGLQLLIHVRPGKKLDPYAGISPGFRIGLPSWTPYVAGMKQPEVSETFPAIVTGIRAGVNYHLYSEYQNWEVGGFVEDSITVYGDETTDKYGSDHKGQTFQSIFAGLRSSVAF